MKPVMCVCAYCFRQKGCLYKQKHNIEELKIATDYLQHEKQIKQNLQVV